MAPALLFANGASIPPSAEGTVWVSEGSHTSVQTGSPLLRGQTQTLLVLATALPSTKALHPAHTCLSNPAPVLPISALHPPHTRPSLSLPAPPRGLETQTGQAAQEPPHVVSPGSSLPLTPHNCCPIRVLALTPGTLQPYPSLQAPCMASCVVGIPSTTFSFSFFQNLFVCASSLVAELELLVGSSPLTRDHTLAPCTGSSSPNHWTTKGHPPPHFLYW